MGVPVAGTVSRRRFFCGAIGALFGSLAIALARAAMPANLDALLRHRAGAQRIGRRYLAMLPADADRSRLLTMSPMLGHALRAVREGPEAAAALLQQGIREDFGRADTVIIDGWVLAATEARLCAVVALA